MQTTPSLQITVVAGDASEDMAVQKPRHRLADVYTIHYKAGVYCSTVL